jgi:hypothetical protein
VSLQYVKPERILLKTHPELGERWVQERIVEDPSLLGLGDLILRDKERTHAGAGRLDLLLQDPDSDHRYEVEIQLGKTDEAHIIRAIEYWDIERKRYPQYEHTAVIVAEDITSRFLNVISLFNGSIPLVALQMNAFKVEDRISLVFTTVVDELGRGPVDEDETPQPTDRAYWVNRASKATVDMADELLGIIHTWDPTFRLKYNKQYIGLARNDQPNNFASFVPKKAWLAVRLRLNRSDEISRQLSDAALDLMSYVRWGAYSIRLTKDDIGKHKELLTGLLRQAYDEFVT